MSAFARLWKRAALWRICLVLGVGGTAMTIFFPTSSIKKYAPWLPGKAPTPLSYQSDPSSHSDDTHQTMGRLGFPDTNNVVTDHTSLAGYTLPLPAGQWHPVLTAQTVDDIPFSFIAFIRTDQGAVTGFITAQATQQPIPQALAENLLTPCHDDRNYISYNNETQKTIDCSFLANAVLGQDTVSLNPFIAEAISRVRQLGFPVPPLMITAGWRHLKATSSHQVNAIAVDTLVAPLSPDTHQMLAPFPTWTKENYKHDPEASRFIAESLKWLPKWQAILQAGVNNTSVEDLSSSDFTDPAAP